MAGELSINWYLKLRRRHTHPFSCCTFLRITPFSKLAVPGRTENRVGLSLEKKRGKNKTKECVVWMVP